MKPPINRKELLNLYCNNPLVSIDSIQTLEPSKIGLLRNSKLDQPLHGADNQFIRIGKYPIAWSFPKKPTTLLEVIGLNHTTLKPPCEKRINFLETELAKLIPLFENEINFIAEFTSSICWIESYAIGSAGFYEVPHCTFFSDSAMFSIPPEIVVDQTHAAYAIFENLYHEALHHQMHAFSTLTYGYFIDELKEKPFISLSWRDRTFTLLEAIHALHIYSTVTPLRLKYYNQNDLPENFYVDSLRMWKDLTTQLCPYFNLFKKPWPDLFLQWTHRH